MTCKKDMGTVGRFEGLKPTKTPKTKLTAFPKTEVDRLDVPDAGGLMDKDNKTLLKGEQRL